MTDTRIVVLALDGRYVTMGRHSTPSADELQRATDALAAQGVTAWLASMDGSPHGKRPPALREIKPLTGEGRFEDAVAAFVRSLR